MDTLSYSAFRTNLASSLDKVNDDHKTVIITRQGGKPAVLISLEDFQAYEETAYLMTSPRNASRLNDAIAKVKAGKTQIRELIEEGFYLGPRTHGAIIFIGNKKIKKH
jgi:antitoxin YefM